MTSKQVVFRVDASLDMGTGHVMRCLTLANALREKGYECHFICREHEGNLVDFVLGQGFHAHPLACSPTTASNGWEYEGEELAHAAWLGASQREDAGACQKVLEKIKPQWLVVDHYALDCQWEQALKPYYERLMVIDDLADRSHQCELLLDQTFGRQVEDYAPWVPAGCKMLCGAHYALLRPEFAEWRSYSLERRQIPQLKHILVTMGGVDKDNVTGSILDALDRMNLPAGCRITVVMGATAPWLDTVCQQAKTISHPTNVLVGVNDMARLMADSDLAIGAAGATSWERCCLGLPTIMVVLAENQKRAASELVKAGAVTVFTLETGALISFERVFSELANEPDRLARMGKHACIVADGKGVHRVADLLSN